MYKSALPYFLFVISALALFSGANAFLLDPDAGWHLAAGKWIIENQAIPSNDPFSYTSNGWQNIAWLWDVSFGFLDMHFGLYAPLAASIIVTSLTLSVICKSSLERSESVIATIIVILFGSVMLIAAASIRPNVTSFLLLAVSILLVSNLKKENRKSYYIILPALAILWANMHGGFVMLFVLLGANWLEALFTKDTHKLRNFTIIGLLCLAATLANPLGYKIYETVLLIANGTLTAYINEWQHANKWYHFIYPAIVVYTVIFSYKKLSTSEILLSIFWLVMAINSARYLPILFIFTAPACALAIASLLKAIKHKDDEYKNDLNSKNSLRIAFCLCLLVITLVIFAQKPLFPNGVKFPQHQAALKIIEQSSAGNILNHYDIGGTLIYLSNADTKTFIDGRADTAFSSELADDYYSITAQQDGWKELLKKYDIKLVAFPKSSLLAQSWEEDKSIKTIFY